MSLKQRSSFVLFMHRFVPVLTVLLAVFSILAINLRTTPVAEAATNSTINFQARLQSASGAIVADGNYNIEFKLYGASSGGTALWTEDHYNSGSNGLRTVNGYFSTKLGSVTAFPSTINWDQELWLTMNVGGTTTGTPTLDGEMDPRLKLTAVPYAISAGQLQTTNGSYTSKLGIQAPTGGNQVFQIQDQGAAGTYNILTAPSGSDGYVKLQGSTPGTQQTGSLNISGTGMVGILQTATIDSGSGTALTIGGTNATSVTIGSGSITTYIQGTASIDKVLSGEFDSGSSAVALNIGNTNATTINIGSTSVARAINIGTGAAAQTVTIGSASSGSSTTINAGGGNLYLSAASGATINNLIGGVTAFQLDTSGRAIFKPTTDGNSSFQVQNASGSGIFYVDTTNNVAASCASCGLTAGTGGISINGGALTIAGGGSTSFRTPGTNGDGSNGVDIATKINIPIYNPGAYSQILALGLSSSAASTARAILIADARTTAHQATIAVLSPDENQIGGFSWDGSNNVFAVKATGSYIDLANNGGTGLRIGSVGAKQTLEVGKGITTDGVLQFNNSTNGSTASIQAPSVSTSYITNLPTAIGTAGQCLYVASVASSTQQLGYGSCGVAAVGTFDSQTASSNGSVISGGNLYLQSASFTNPGLVNTTAQTFTGDKTFKSTSNSATAFQIQNSSSAAVFSVNTSTAGVTVTGNLTQATGAISLTGNAASQVSTSSGNLTLDSAATVNVGTANATGVTIGNTSNTTAVLLQGSASATYTIGTSSNTGGITLGNSTASNTINIGNATIAAGNTGTINIGTSSTSTGKTTVTIGSTNDGSALNLQAGTGNINLLTNSASASTIVKTNTNSTTAFQIQNASSAILFNADTSTGTITLGSSGSGNYITFTAGGGLESYGTARHGKSMVFSPEYTNAVLDAASDSSCSSANSGTLTSAYDATNYRNYYNWTSTSGSNQCYDVVVDVVLPNDFSSWASSDPINLQALASNTSNAGYAIAVRNVTGAAWDGNYGSAYASPGSISTSWTDVASSSFSGTYNAGDRLSIKVRMSAKSSANLQLGNLTLNYNSKW